MLPPKINQRGKSDYYFYSPEEYQYLNFRSKIERSNFDRFKSEIFSFGMLMLSIANFKDYKEFYGKFCTHNEVLAGALAEFESKYGYHMAHVLEKCLQIDPFHRIAAPDVVLLMKSQELADTEKEKLQQQKFEMINNINLRPQISMQEAEFLDSPEKGETPMNAMGESVPSPLN